MKGRPTGFGVAARPRHSPRLWSSCEVERVVFSPPLFTPRHACGTLVPCVPFCVQLSEYEEGEVPPPGTKRIRSLEDQVERLSVENMRMNETARNLKEQVLLVTCRCCFESLLWLVVTDSWWWWWWWWCIFSSGESGWRCCCCRGCCWIGRDAATLLTSNTTQQDKTKHNKHKAKPTTQHKPLTQHVAVVPLLYCCRSSARRSN